MLEVFRTSSQTRVRRKKQEFPEPRRERQAPEAITGGIRPNGSARTIVCRRTSAFSAAPVALFRRLDYGGNLCRKCLGEISEGSQRRALGAPLQLADVAFGISQIVRQF